MELLYQEDSVVPANDELNRQIEKKIGDETMATLNVYDKDTGLTKSVTIDISSSVVNGSHIGSQSFYVTVSTSARDTSGGEVPKIILTDGDFTDDLTSVVRSSIVELFKHMLGQYLSSSSSSSVTESFSSISGPSSQSSETSDTTRLLGTSSSESSNSDASSTYSAHP